MTVVAVDVAAVLEMIRGKRVFARWRARLAACDALAQATRGTFGCRRPWLMETKAGAC